MRPIEGSSLSPGSREQRGPGDMPADPGSGSRRVVIGEIGSLDSLRVEAFVPRNPGHGEVRIEVTPPASTS